MGVSQSGPQTRHFRWNPERFELRVTLAGQKSALRPHR